MSIELCNTRYPQPPYDECTDNERTALEHLQAARNICPESAIESIDAAMLAILLPYRREKGW